MLLKGAGDIVLDINIASLFKKSILDKFIREKTSIHLPNFITDILNPIQGSILKSSYLLEGLFLIYFVGHDMQLDMFIFVFIYVVYSNKCS